MKFLKSTPLAILIVACLALAAPALAQTGWSPVAGGQTQVAVSGSSANAAITKAPGTTPTSIFIDNSANAFDVHFVLSTSGSTTAALTDYLVPAGCTRSYALGSQTRIAAITPGGTGTLTVQTGSGPPPANSCGGAGASTNVTVSGTVSIDQTTPGTTNGVQVNAALPAGQNGIGNVGGKTVSVCVTPTVTASNAYGTNYVVGGLLTFANAFTSTGSGLLQGVVVTINDNETSGFTFFPFNANPSGTTWTDAAVAAIVAGDVAKVRNPVSLNGNNQLKSTVFSVYSAAALGEALAPGTTSLYGVLIANAALTNNFAGTSDVQVCVKVLDDE